MEENNRSYITTSIAYANSVPHIGFAMEALQADAMARYRAMKGGEVFFCSGTDEHGSKIKRTAVEKGLEPQAFVDGNAARFRELLRMLGISNTAFIRTTDGKHKAAAQKLWKKLFEKGDLEKRTYQGNYCVGCEAFLTEHDLVDGKCPYHQKEPEKVEESNWFFKVSNYLDKIQEKIESGELEIIPEARKNEILNIIKNAENEKTDVSFSRPKSTLDWGIPVPDDPDQVMYVWCDALTNYISALDYAEDGNGENFKKFWLENEDITHVIGKDILRFHAMVWPAMLLSAGLPLPKKICVHGFITSGGQKMSKSLGNVIDPFSVAEKYGVEALRYYLLKEIPTTEDGDFSYGHFEEVYKSDLQNGLGNLVSRVLAMIEKYFDGKIPELDEKHLNDILVSKEIMKDFQGFDGKYANKDTHILTLAYDIDYGFGMSHYERFELNKILENINDLVRILDKYIQYYEPFKLIKEDKEKTGSILNVCSRAILIIAQNIYPFMPKTSEKIYSQFNTTLGSLTPGNPVKKGEALFPRLEE